MIKERIDAYLLLLEPSRKVLHELEDLLVDAYHTKQITSEDFYEYTNVILQKYYRELANRFLALDYGHVDIMRNWGLGDRTIVKRVDIYCELL